ncbi:unnamed protein product [Blepharisma stoltei]|uniref:Uncharacterized protein n=1 Tax=Blepharisma stoltei TaxID=1481888 RepID=A0AAU9JKF6_9CILI|nr:unnamed protein product [Blepharisma stoltei]
MVKYLQFNDKTIKFNIWDTAGQERYHNLAIMYYRDANAVIMTYDITKRESFESLKRWHWELQEFGPKDIVVIIAGNKKDLVENEAVSLEEAKYFANLIGAIYLKTSARMNYEVEQLFREIAAKCCPEFNSPQSAPKRNTIALDNKGNQTQKKCF